MPTHDQRREARLAKLRDQSLRETRDRAQRRLRLLPLPSDELGYWHKPAEGGPPGHALICVHCAKAFSSAAALAAHRVHAGLPIERCATSEELGATQWRRTIAGMWSFGPWAATWADNAERYARLNLERLASVRAERERFDLGEPVGRAPGVSAVHSTTDTDAAKPRPKNTGIYGISDMPNSRSSVGREAA